MPSRAVRLSAAARVVEDAAAAGSLALMALLPAIEVVLRALFGTGIPGTSGYVENLTLWVAYLGAVIAAREGRHLDLSTGTSRFPPAMRRAAAVVVAFLSAAVVAGLFWASFQFVQAETSVSLRIGGWLPVALAEAILPLAFAAIAAHLVARAETWSERLAAFLGLAGAAAGGFFLEPQAGLLLWPGIAILVLAALLGVPIFVAIGGMALLLFFADGVPVAAISVETYRVVASPSIATIPLFTLAGYLLAEGGASRRLVRLFRAWFGWLPGGAAIAATLVCAFFSTFTGASGVTILALGGLLLPVLLKSGYSEDFALGLVTSTGSIGMLFPPSLAVILYGVVAHISIPDLFKAGIGPGLLMVGAVCVYGVYRGIVGHVERSAFDPREAAAALWEAKWELLVPVVALYGIFGGFSTLTEAAAITVIYVFAVVSLIHRDLRRIADLAVVLVRSGTLVGGVFIILGVAMGLTNFLVDAEIPSQAANWVKAHVGMRLEFLLALNLFLLVVGCLDGFSAIIIAVPLVQPISAAFGIHPLHLAMIFLVNLELGYLMPPVGMNLFLASYRFDRALSAIYRSAVPFIAVLLVVLLLVTYWPSLIIGVD
ncbi:MAG TPA: TRAP transporter large permease subunit [Stellaceae bacterium]|nr:TRAP transporter large permease subunit [Stellaceae bacterium]